MEFLTSNASEITGVIGGILISDIVGMSRLKANSVCQLVIQIFKTINILKKK